MSFHALFRLFDALTTAAAGLAAVLWGDRR
jgi:hypothetical protein